MAALQANSTLQAYGCGKPNPDFLYREEPEHLQEITTLDEEHCGELFIPSRYGPHAIFLCAECVVRHGLIY